MGKKRIKALFAALLAVALLILSGCSGQTAEEEAEAPPELGQ